MEIKVEDMISGEANVYQVFEHRVHGTDHVFDKENMVIVIFGLEEEPVKM